MNYYKDIDSTETQEWLDAFESVLKHSDGKRAEFLIKALYDMAVQKGLPVNNLATAYINSIPAENEPSYPGDLHIERKLRAIIRYNALAMVVRANKNEDELGGHLASFASSATLYETGMNHFFRAATEHFGGDMVYFQGHTAPGMYARSFLEGRLTEEQLANFRREVGGKGLSSYPHPYLMPDYWQFPTVSMGLGPIMSIYNAHVHKYLINRGLLADEGRKIWAFLGDGETDEPESLGAISLASREKLDNLIWVINCNLQRLDGPVRGNGKIIQELESNFRGAGWNVIKVVWGSGWDKLLAKDHSGALKRRMLEAVDGEYQMYKARDGAYVREHFFGKYPETREMVADMTDEEIFRLARGGHDPVKVYSAFSQAMKAKDRPTVILVKTIKGYGLSPQAQAVNKTHQIKKLDKDALMYFRDHFDLPFTDEQLDELPFYRPDENSAEMKYLRGRREALGGHLPNRRSGHIPLEVPELSAFSKILQGSGGKEQSTTMVFVRILSAMLRDKGIKERVVPIVPDEARTFGLEGMFRQLGIYSSVGQKYVPEDNEALMGYKEATDGHMLEEGINEAGAMSAWIALATSYSNHALPMIPMYIYYSMFGFQRIGDLAWAAGDSQAQGFLLGATAGRTTLNGEGLQHQDGHSHILFGTVPNCVSYDPCYGYELAVIMQDGLRRMYAKGERVYYYITLMNENYEHPMMPDGVEEGIKRGMYLLEDNGSDKVQLMGSGVILREVQKASRILKDEFNIPANVWSVTSYNELTRDGMACDDYNRLHPMEEDKVPWVTQQLAEHKGVVVSATDYMRNYAEQIRGWLPDSDNYSTLGTDGFGRSDSRQKLRSFFNVDAEHIVLATLKQLADSGKIQAQLVQDAIDKFNIDVDHPPAWQPQPHYDHFPDAPAPKVMNPNPVPELKEEE
ncbi:MAG: pyruvate dehydrogenase (acetyl-transferring), homodimeric type [Moraxellaceae bacterium]|nr:pyruvate dehydrogenase (acetyl-transferring), homodimeric type [Moraxellaceae bacterium]